MSSWANLKIVPSKKKESIRNYFSSLSSNYAESSLAFLYTHLYLQRNAEPFYVYDKDGFFQPHFETSAVVHYLREEPTSGENLATNISTFAPILNTMSLTSLKRNSSNVFQYNGQTKDRINDALSKYGLSKPTFDVGVLLDISGCVPQVFTALRMFQKRTGKKTLKLFIQTDSMDLLKEFASKGDSCWSYVSLMRIGVPPTLLKSMCELKLLQDIEYIVGKFSNPLGKLVYLTNPKITMESQFMSVDGSTWKALP
jgi:hypothetical protein